MRQKAVSRGRSRLQGWGDPSPADLFRLYTAHQVCLPSGMLVLRLQVRERTSRIGINPQTVRRNVRRLLFEGKLQDNPRFEGENLEIPRDGVVSVFGKGAVLGNEETDPNVDQIWSVSRK